MIKRACPKNMTKNMCAHEDENTIHFCLFKNDIEGRATRPRRTPPPFYNHCLFPKWLTKPPPSFSTVALPITSKHISTLRSGEIGPLKSGA